MGTFIIEIIHGEKREKFVFESFSAQSDAEGSEIREFGSDRRRREVGLDADWALDNFITLMEQDAATYTQTQYIQKSGTFYRDKLDGNKDVNITAITTH